MNLSVGGCEIFELVSTFRIIERFLTIPSSNELVSIQQIWWQREELTDEVGQQQQLDEQRVQCKLLILILSGTISKGPLWIQSVTLKFGPNFFSELQRWGVYTRKVWFQQDGVISYTHAASMEVLCQKFLDVHFTFWVHSVGPHFSDLITCNFFLWNT